MMQFECPCCGNAKLLDGEVTKLDEYGRGEMDLACFGCGTKSEAKFEITEIDKASWKEDLPKCD